MRLSGIEDIVRLDLCVGCGICQAVAGEDCIKMHLSQAGFLRPVVLGDYAEFWDLIKQICPGIAVRHEQGVGNRPWDKLWGPLVGLKAGYATDEILRWCGSSGGAIGALLCYLLEQGYVDYVLHVGARAADPLQTQIYLSRNREDITKCAGSRYAPAAPLTNVKRLLEQNDGRMAFVGKPCDVVALRAFLQLRPNLASKVFCVIAFLCAGTPSIHATKDMIMSMGSDPDKVVNLRYRGHGWPGQVQAVTDDGVAYEMSYHDSWGKILGRQLQFRCKVCADGIGELADVTCGDAWYAKNGSPCFEDRPGRSLVVCRTGIGQDVVDGAVRTGYLVTKAFSLRDIEIIQPYQAMRRKLVASRLLAMWISGVRLPQYSGFHLIHSAFQTSLENNWDSFTGMLRRLRNKPYYEKRLAFRLLGTIAAKRS